MDTSSGDALAGRQVGRSRDPAEARRRILNAGAAVFAEAGFAGARVERIAAQAGLNKRMLYHYFGDKSGLYRAVMKDCLADLRVPDGEGPECAQATHADDPTLARLLLWHLLTAAVGERPDDSPAPAGAVLDAIESARRRGQLPRLLNGMASALIAGLSEAPRTGPETPIGAGLGPGPAAAPDVPRWKPRIRLKHPG